MEDRAVKEGALVSDSDGRAGVVVEEDIDLLEDGIDRY